MTTAAALDRPLRIGICAPYDLSRAGGVNSHIRAQARALGRLGHQVVVFGAASRGVERGEIAVGRCSSMVIGGTDTALGFDPRVARRVAALFRSRPLDVLHVHEPLMPLAPWCATLQSPVPVVGTFHVHREGGHRWYGPFRRLLEPVMRRLSIRIAVSEAARRTVSAHFDYPCEVVPNGIEVARFERDTGRPPDVDDRHQHVLFVGRIEPRKGIDRLIAAMRRVQQRFESARLVVVGDGPGRRAAEDAARRAGVAALFAGRVPDAMLPAYFRAADIVCSPALGDESFGIVLLEAMAARRPVVATRIAGYTELLAGADAAELVKAGSEQELADAIERLLADPGAAAALGGRGAALARKYDWNTLARRLESMYASLVPRATEARAG